MGGGEVEGPVRRHRSIMFGVLLCASVALASLLPAVAVADDGSQPHESADLQAYLDGKPIPPADVSKYFCDDFSYPVIHCSVSPLVTAARATVVSLLTSVDYVTVYEQAGFGGPYMNISQDYGWLATIGWNDRISSFRARNGETGTFFVDWFSGGSQWSFCCNTQQSSLGGYDNSFSSLKRT
jgi:hypothetical protein